MSRLAVILFIVLVDVPCLLVVSLVVLSRTLIVGREQAAQEFRERLDMFMVARSRLWHMS